MMPRWQSLELSRASDPVHMSLPNAQMAVNEDQLALANVQMALTIVQ